MTPQRFSMPSRIILQGLKISEQLLTEEYYGIHSKNSPNLDLINKGQLSWTMALTTDYTRSGLMQTHN